MGKAIIMPEFGHIYVKEVQMWIYLTVNKLNGKMYVGRNSRRDPNYLGSGTLLKESIEKHGKENFTYIILEDLGIDADLRSAIDCEKKWIGIFHAPVNPMFYNLSWDTGGMGVGDTHSEETKQLIKEKMKEVYVNGLPPEWKKNVVEALKGRVPWNKGKKKDDLPSSMYENRRPTGRGHGKQFTQEEFELVKAEYEAGVSASKIAQKWGVDHHKILKMIRRDSPENLTNKGRKLRPKTDEEKKKLSEAVKRSILERKN